MEYSLNVWVRFADWKDNSKAFNEREMLRRRKMAERISKKFKKLYPSKVVQREVQFPRADENLEKQIRAFLKGKVLKAYYIKEDLPSPKALKKKQYPKPKPAVISQQQVQAFLKQRGVLICQSETAQRVEIRVEHRTRGGAKEADIAAAEKKLGFELLPSHRRLLAMTDGCAIFADAAQKSDSGLVLYSLKEMLRENLKTKKRMGGDTDPGLATKLFVGEPAGFGNWIATNYRRESKLGEPPIVYVDHEGGSRDGKIVAESFEDLIRKLGKDPVAMFRKELDGSVLYTDKKREMLTVKEYRRT